MARDVIIDTDPGVDDALALLMAFRSPELRIRAVTVVAGNVPRDVGLRNALCLAEAAARKDIPVYAGAVKPLERRLVVAESHGTDGLGGVKLSDPRLKPSPGEAADAIRRLVREHPGKISVITLGPMTNLALALRADPGIAALIPQLVFMGGAVGEGNMTPAAEFNIYVDPEAARVVLHSGIPLVMVGLDVTRQVLLDDAHVQRLEASTHATLAARIARSALERYRTAGWGGMAMHDPLAAAVFLDPTIVATRKFFVDVETSGELTAGETVAYDSAPIRPSAPRNGSTESHIRTREFHPNVDVAVAVDAGRFFTLFLDRLTAPPARPDR